MPYLYILNNLKVELHLKSLLSKLETLHTVCPAERQNKRPMNKCYEKYLHIFSDFRGSAFVIEHLCLGV